MFIKTLSIVIIVVNSFVSSCCVCRSECNWFIGVLRDLDGLPVLYCLKSENCRMTSSDGKLLLSQCKMGGSTTSGGRLWGVLGAKAHPYCLRRHRKSGVITLLRCAASATPPEPQSAWPSAP